MAAESEKTSSLFNLFSYSNLVHAVSGATGSVIAISVFYPLDTVRTRLQVDDHRHAKNTFLVLKEILKEEGLEGVYLGWLPVVTALCCSNFVYFYTYNGLKSYILGGRKKASPFVDLSMAFVSGVVNVLITTPLWVANTRLKLQDCVLKIIRTEGVSKLWGGTIPSILLATNPAIQFMIYEALKRYFKRYMVVEDLSGLMYFILGAVAKSAATVITYPLQVVQSRLRAGFAKEENAQSLKQNITYLIRTRGLGALYKGLEAKLLQTVLTAALMFAIYEKIAAFIFRIMGMK